MICNQCTIYYTSDDGSCPQCKIMAVDRLLKMTNLIQIDEHIKKYYAMIFRHYINKYNIETRNINTKIFIITKQRFLNNLGDYLKSNPEEIIIYMSGMKDGLRKYINSHVADTIFNYLIDRMFVSDEDIFKLIHSIGPFIIDPWNCIYENTYLDEYYVKKGQLVSLEDLFNQWTYQNILHYYNPIEYSNCLYCSESIIIGEQNTRCIICNEHFHNQCFTNPFHECKEEHFEHNIDSLIEDLINI